MPVAASRVPTPAIQRGSTRVIRVEAICAADDDAERERQEREAGLQRRVAQHLLDVEAEEVEHREHRGTDDEHHGEGRAAGAVGQDADRHEGVGGAHLDDDEGDEHRDTGDEGGEGGGRGPGVAGGVGEAVDEGDQATGAEDRPGDVDPALAAARTRRGSAGRGRRRARPIGTLMNIVQRQSISVRAPPRMRPTAAPAPDIAAYTPMARLRAGPAGKVVVIRARAVGEARAAPTPCRARAPSSMPSVWARPPRREAPAKTSTPVMKTLRRPNRSPRRPPRSSRPPKARV